MDMLLKKVNVGLQCGVLQANLSRHTVTTLSINEFNNMQMLISNFNPSVSEDEWHASGEERPPLDKPG